MSIHTSAGGMRAKCGLAAAMAATGVDVHLTLLAVKLYMHGICHAYIRDVVIESCGTMCWLVILSSLHCLVLSLSAAVSGCQRLSSAVSAVSAVSAIRAVRPPASAPAPISDPDPSGHYYHTELALAPATGHPPHPRAPAAYPPTPCKFGPFRISLPILREYSKSIRHDTLQRTNHRGVKPTAVKVRHALHIRARINA